MFECSDFLVTDESALVCLLQSTLFEEIELSKKKGYTIMHGIKSAISAIAVHPRTSILAIAGSEGFILLWDYLKKGDPISNYELFKEDTGSKNTTDGKIFTAIEFTPDGSEILVAQQNGEIKIMDSQTGHFKKLNTPLKTSDRKGYPIKQLIVSHDGKYFAVSDNNRSVCLFKKDHLHGDIQKPIEWQFSGKILSHEIEITSISFG